MTDYPPPQVDATTAAPIQKKPWWKRPWGIGLIVIVAIGVLSNLGGEEPTAPAADTAAAPAPVEQADVDTAAEDAGTDDEPADEVPVEEAAAPEAPPAPEPEPEPAMSREQQNAMRQGENYLSMSGFSRTGLIDQLAFEGYTTENATAAVDALDVDWNEQAARKPETYLEMTAFSPSGLIEQLEFEGLTREQAEYGVSQTGL